MNISQLQSASGAGAAVSMCAGDGDHGGDAPHASAAPRQVRLSPVPERILLRRVQLQVVAKLCDANCRTSVTARKPRCDP